MVSTGSQRIAESQHFKLFARTFCDGLADLQAQDFLIRIAGRRIDSVRPAMAVSHLPGHWLEREIVTLGFIDLQINGANDVHFNHAPITDGMRTIAKDARRRNRATIAPFTMAPRTGAPADRRCRSRRDLRGTLQSFWGSALKARSSLARPGIRPAKQICQTLGREPGIMGEVLDTRQGLGGIIADGIHVHLLNLGLAACTLPDGLCLVTYAMQSLAGRQFGFDL